MTILDRYLAAQFAGALARCAAAFIMLYVLVDLVTARRNDITQFGVPPDAVAVYYLNLAPGIFYDTAPLALLVSALMVLGAAAQNNEVTAVLAAGVSLRRLVRMPVLLALGFAALVFGLEEGFGSAAARRAAAIEARHFSTDALVARDAIAWSNLSGEWTCIVRKFNRRALTGEDVAISARREQEIEQIMARRMFWHPERREWLLEDGTWVVLEPERNEQRSIERFSQVSAPFSETPQALFALEEDPRHKRAGTLKQEILQAEARGTPVQPHWVDYHAKFSWPAACFVMIWLAVPFALRLRRGGLAISFGASIATALIYLTVYGAGVLLGHAERIPPLAAAWLANAVFLAVGAILFWRTPT